MTDVWLRNNARKKQQPEGRLPLTQINLAQTSVRNQAFCMIWQIFLRTELPESYYQFALAFTHSCASWSYFLLGSLQRGTCGVLSNQLTRTCLSSLVWRCHKSPKKQLLQVMQTICSILFKLPTFFYTDPAIDLGARDPELWHQRDRTTCKILYVH